MNESNLNLNLYGLIWKAGDSMEKKRYYSKEK